MFYFALIGNNYYYRPIQNPNDFQEWEYFSEAVFNMTGQAPPMQTTLELPNNPQWMLQEI